MSRRLHLLRHAKSSWTEPGRSDHDRPLSPRGVRAAAALAVHVRTSGQVRPQLVLCSSARRAVETLAGIRDGLPADVEVVVDDELYAASPHVLLERVRTVDPDVAEVLLVAHNPATWLLAVSLAGGGEPQTLARLEAGCPTGALTSLDVDGPWDTLAAGAATLRAFVIPADLPDP